MGFEQFAQDPRPLLVCLGMPERQYKQCLLYEELNEKIKALHSWKMRVRDDRQRRQRKSPGLNLHGTYYGKDYVLAINKSLIKSIRETLVELKQLNML